MTGFVKCFAYMITFNPLNKPMLGINYLHFIDVKSDQMGQLAQDHASK
jgi:hypothetical protein